MRIFDAIKKSLSGKTGRIGGETYQPQLRRGDSAEKVVVRRQIEQIGSSGTCIQAGMFDEDYLVDLQGRCGADAYDKMRRSDSRVKRCLNAVKKPIKKAVWKWEPASDSPEDVANAELVTAVFNKYLDRGWQETLTEVLSYVDFGFSLFEPHHKIMQNTEFGTIVVFESLGWRSQRTIDKWNLERKTGRILSVDQIDEGDVGSNSIIQIPGEDITVFSLDKEGDNYEGISALRTLYGPWFRKQMFLKLQAIGVEKNAVPTPKVQMPEQKIRTEDANEMKEVIKAYTSHQSNFIMYPAGWTVDFLESKFDPSKLKIVIDFENSEMADSFLQGFLDLGQGQNGGSYSLGTDLSDFYLASLLCIADQIAETMTKCFGVPIVKLNRPNVKEFPKLTHSGINDKAGEELANVLDKLTKNKIIRPDDRLEESVRKRYQLPEMSEDGREEREISSGAPGNEEGGGAPIEVKAVQPARLTAVQLVAATRVRAQITRNADSIHEVMLKHLLKMGDSLVADVMKRAKKTDNEQSVLAGLGVSKEDQERYRTELLQAFVDTSSDAIKLATEDVNKQAASLADIKKLPKKIRVKITNLADLYVATQGADLEKSVFFQFSNSVDSSLENPVILEQDLKEAAESFAKGGPIKTGATIASSRVVNDSRNSYFFSKEVLSDVESFTFTNPDPKSLICKDLTGTTFDANDPRANRYFPPLHHNCKSFLAPNLKGTKASKQKKTQLKPSKKSLEDSITLTSVANCCG